MVAHACNPSMQEAEKVDLHVLEEHMSTQRVPGLHSEFWQPGLRRDLVFKK